MGENDKKMPKFDSLDALTDFFDENDMGEYLDDAPAAEFSVDLIRRKHYIAVDEEIADRLSEISRHEHLPSGSIANSWLREKIADYSHKQ